MPYMPLFYYIAFGYSSRATLGKARSKIKRALSDSPTKQHAALMSVIREFPERKDFLVSLIKICLQANETKL